LATPYYQLVFIHSGSVAGLINTGATVLYNTQPTDQTRGDFEDKFTPAGAGTSGLSADIGIPKSTWNSRVNQSLLRLVS